jgi:23S rRNA (adenine2503-C2)-methyltransferase
MNKINVKNMSLIELQEFVVQNGLPKFRAKQVYDWMYRGVSNFEGMKNLSKDAISKLQEVAYIGKLEMVERLESQKDETIKYLFKLEDGNIIESVRMKYSYGNTVCMSSQVGCKMGCSFCASGIGGFVRNLTAGEMIDQILQISLDINDRISRVVLMGSGEPLDNYNEVLKFLDIANSPEALNIGMRKITISTSGLVDKIYDLADKNIQVNLSISLHASNDEIRKQIMPVAKKYDIEELLKACKYYISKTKRRITFEYSLIQDVNSSNRHAEELKNLLGKLMCHVNLIPVNKVKEKGYRGPTMKEVQNFASILERAEIPVTIRRELGSDINAACGQLRRSFLNAD